MSYAGFCEQCQIPYYEMDALAHRHDSEPAAANLQLPKEWAQDVDTRPRPKFEDRYCGNWEPASAPAVEPQKDELLGDICKWIDSNGNVTPSLLQRNFRIGYSRAVAAIESIEKEGLLKRIEQEKFNSFKWEWIKPEAGSTPQNWKQEAGKEIAERLFADAVKERKAAEAGGTRPEPQKSACPAEVAKRIYNEVPFTISEKEWIERTSIILAASVQQEPRPRFCSNFDCVKDLIESELRQWKLALPEAQPAPPVISTKQFDNIVRDICELPDYSSPEDQPEVFMCTTEELRVILVNNGVMEDLPSPPEPTPAKKEDQ